MVTLDSDAYLTVGHVDQAYQVCLLLKSKWNIIWVHLFLSFCYTSLVYKCITANGQTLQEL